MMNRRSFLRTLGLGIVCAPVLVKAVGEKNSPRTIDLNMDFFEDHSFTKLDNGGPCALGFTDKEPSAGELVGKGLGTMIKNSPHSSWADFGAEDAERIAKTYQLYASEEFKRAAGLRS